MRLVVTWLIVAIIAVMLLIGVFKAAKAAAIPVTILVVIILTIALVRTFFTKENLNKLHDTVEQTGIGSAVEQGLTDSVGKRKSSDEKTVSASPVAAEVEKPVEKTVNVAPVAAEVEKPVEKTVSVAPVAAYAEKPVEKTAPASIAQQVQSVPEVAQAETSPTAVDCSKYDKGRKTFTYALPFNAKVTMSFKDGAYKFIVDSLGRLSSSDKKEIGKLMLKSLSSYRGKTTDVDKTKVSIDINYDVKSNHTQVFIVVPLDAVE